MIKVHCFVSCVCEVLKKNGIDHRPYYFGVWDADFFLDEHDRLTYHKENVDHTFFKNWYETLYGITLTEWYKNTASKEENVENLIQLIEEKDDDTHVIVMLDLALLPERENKFHHAPFPHYVMLEKTQDNDVWMMYDPDFRWEGEMDKAQILNAVRSHDVAGGYRFNGKTIQPPSDDTIKAYFRTCMKGRENPLTETLQSLVETFWSGSQRHRLNELGLVMKQLPVLAIRKYAYEHAFAFFWKALQFSENTFEQWCDEIESLEKGFKIVQYQAMKVAKTKKEADYEQLCNQLKRQNERERRIKAQLILYFNEWLLIEKPLVLHQR
ncbi:DUF6005 family protein [Shouchella lehensis]|uniref:Petrobactin biosynthesis protein AsbE n=1 Tax=Shouchella lehensis TaxID=300825 RepID=A0A4Y7WIU4_9BACI|nr:DUF6005 family protein [Shouchella lehensis]MBG9785811.1 Petrobactin biosynthesis protein AsbE [Shouchella lehensis]RQW20102.1 Petrobactin biosynthesis protein AsbE [Bacillus sp. C1-1]TES48279.1 Petrobactin biosynthesis protein AsbE [Shouchella lehensis]